MLRIKRVIMMMATIAVSAASFAGGNNSPVGYWQTIDDASGEAKSIVQISELPNHSLEGKVVKLYTDPNKVCVACKGDKKDKPIVGMVIMQGLTQVTDTPNVWSKGHILDPKNGKTYQCDIKISSDNKELNVRGYIGVSLFGRTQTWKSVPNSMS